MINSVQMLDILTYFDIFSSHPRICRLKKFLLWEQPPEWGPFSFFRESARSQHFQIRSKGRSWEIVEWKSLTNIKSTVNSNTMKGLCEHFPTNALPSVDLVLLPFHFTALWHDIETSIKFYGMCPACEPQACNLISFYLKETPNRQVLEVVWTEIALSCSNSLSSLISGKLKGGLPGISLLGCGRKGLCWDHEDYAVHFPSGTSLEGLPIFYVFYVSRSWVRMGLGSSTITSADWTTHYGGVIVPPNPGTNLELILELNIHYFHPIRISEPDMKH